MKKRTILTILILIIMFAIVIDPAKYIKSAMDGMLVFTLNVIPALFPFMFLSKILSELGSFRRSKRLAGFYKKTFKVPKLTFCTFLMSAICGYPIGAKLTAESFDRGEISVTDAKKLTAFCSNGSIIFVLGTVGASMLGNVKIGVFIYLSNILACIITGIAAGLLIKHKDETVFGNGINAQQARDGNILIHSMTNAVISIFIVGGYIVLFYVVTEMLFTYQIFYPLQFLLSKLCVGLGQSPFIADGIIAGMCEFTRGCKQISEYGLFAPLSASLCAFIVSFGGASIALQSMTYLSKCKVTFRYYFFVKLIHGLLAAVICYPLALLF